MSAPTSLPPSGEWRPRVRRQIAWTLLVKLLALIALWALFFSPEHRVEVTPERVQDQLIPPSSSPGVAP